METLRGAGRTHHVLTTKENGLQCHPKSRLTGVPDRRSPRRSDYGCRCYARAWRWRKPASSAVDWVDDARSMSSSSARETITPLVPRLNSGIRRLSRQRPSSRASAPRRRRKLSDYFSRHRDDSSIPSTTQPQRLEKFLASSANWREKPQDRRLGFENQGHPPVDDLLAGLWRQRQDGDALYLTAVRLSERSPPCARTPTRWPTRFRHRLHSCSDAIARIWAG